MLYSIIHDLSRFCLPGLVVSLLYVMIWFCYDLSFKFPAIYVTLHFGTDEFLSF